MSRLLLTTIVLLVVTVLFEDCSLAMPLSSTAERTATAAPCTTPACRTAALDLLSFMNASADPCLDFAEFVCGNFSRNAEIPPDRTSVTSLDEVEASLENNLREVLEKPVQSGAPKYEAFLKNFYKSCTDSAAIEEGGVPSLLQLLRGLGGWPLMEGSWDEGRVDLTNLLGELMVLLDQGIFGSEVHSDESNSSVHLFTIFPIDLTFPKDYYKDTERVEMLEALKNYITDVALHLSTNCNKESMKKDVEEIINFEKNLSKIILPPEESRLLDQEKISLDTLAKLFNKTIRFHDLINSVFGNVGISVDRSVTVGVYEYSYFKNLSLLLERTPKRNVVNYLLWVTVEQFVVALPHKFENFTATFKSVVEGVSEIRPRWKRCISLIKQNMHLPLGALYVKSYFNRSAKIKVHELIKELKQSFESMILHVPWLLNETKTFAIEKLASMRNYSGYPDYFDEERLFVDMFKKVTVRPATLLEGITIAISTRKRENLKLLGKPVDKNRPDFEIAVVNAYYSPLLNAIVFPAGILQWPFFSDSLPMYINFGGIAYAIGHEITHGFDDRGRKYDKGGNFFNWWKDEDQQLFHNASQCFVDQYGNFVVEDIDEHVNGKLTLGENIADNGGLRASFMAYKHWMKINGKESSLPDLPFTSEQMFFISFGRVYCHKMRPEAEANYVRQNVHALGRFRTIGSLMNMKEFSEAFQCPLGSPMNPCNKCRVW